VAVEAAIVVAAEEVSVETAEAVGEAAGATLEYEEAVVSEAIEAGVEVVVDEAVVPASLFRSSRKLKALVRRKHSSRVLIMHIATPKPKIQRLLKSKTRRIQQPRSCPTLGASS
jgi:hypothetical protein